MTRLPPHLHPADYETPAFAGNQKTAKKFIQATAQAGITFYMYMVNDYQPPFLTISDKPVFVPLKKAKEQNVAKQIHEFFALMPLSSKTKKAPNISRLKKEISKAIQSKPLHYLKEGKGAWLAGYLNYVNKCEKTSHELAKSIISQLSTRKVITFALPLVVKNVLKLKRIGERKYAKEGKQKKGNNAD